jgi:FMN phosphatase YigB (HAD superfamily)
MLKCIIFDLNGVLHPDEDGSAHQVFKQIKKLGLETAAITHIGTRTARKIARDYGIKKVYISQELRFAKTDPTIYQKFLADNDLKAQECLMIDDIAINLRQPQKLGMTTVYLGSDHTPYADYQINQMADLWPVIQKLAKEE